MRKENLDRAKRIDAALKVYAEHLDAEHEEIEEISDYGGEPAEEKLSDLLSDLMHWAEREKLKFDARLRHARDSYHAERVNPKNCADVPYPAAEYDKGKGKVCEC